MTSRFLLEGGFNFFNELWWWNQPPDSGIPTGFQPNAIIPKFEVANATLYGSSSTDIRAYNHQYNVRGAANYVTGSHAFKVGMQHMWGTRNFTYTTTQNQLWSFFNGAPVAITQYARPLEDYQKLKTALGLYAQDRWTIRNITLNLGAAVRLPQRLRPGPEHPGAAVRAGEGLPGDAGYAVVEEHLAACRHCLGSVRER